MSNYKAKKKKKVKVPKKVNQLLNKGIDYESQLKYVKAIGYFKKAVMINAKNKFLWQNLAFSYYDIRSKNNAIKALNRAKELDQSDENTLEALVAIRNVKFFKYFWLISCTGFIIFCVITLAFNLKHPITSDLDVIIFFIMFISLFSYFNSLISLRALKSIYEIRESLRIGEISNYKTNSGYYYNFQRVKKYRTILNIVLFSLFMGCGVYLCISIYFF